MRFQVSDWLMSVAVIALTLGWLRAVAQAGYDDAVTYWAFHVVTAFFALGWFLLGVSYCMRVSTTEFVVRTRDGHEIATYQSCFKAEDMARQCGGTVTKVYKGEAIATYEPEVNDGNTV